MSEFTKDIKRVTPEMHGCERQESSEETEIAGFDEVFGEITADGPDYRNVWDTLTHTPASMVKYS